MFLKKIKIFIIGIAIKFLEKQIFIREFRGLGVFFIGQLLVFKVHNVNLLRYFIDRGGSFFLRSPRLLGESMLFIEPRMLHFTRENRTSFKVGIFSPFIDHLYPFYW